MRGGGTSVPARAARSGSGDGGGSRVEPWEMRSLETHVPAQHSQAEEEARLSGADAHRGGSAAAPGPAASRPRPPVGLIGRVRDRATLAALAGARGVRRGPVAVACLTGDNLPARARTADGPRVAYAVGRRVGSAVVRNRVRRRLRAAVCVHASLLEPGAAYLVSAGPAAARLEYQDLEEAVGAALGARSRVAR